MGPSSLNSLDRHRRFGVGSGQQFDSAVDPMSQEKIDPIQEVRFAVTIYGGVSLAIYINGIVQELLHLVRSTAVDPATGDGIEELRETEAVYRELARAV